MTITICGSMKFYEAMLQCEKKLPQKGHTVFVPKQAAGVDYWANDNSVRVEAKRSMELIEEHFKNIEQSDAILVVNPAKGEVAHYIGANTFLEMGYAYYRKIPIYVLNKLPDMPYIADALLTFNPIVLEGDLGKIR